MRRDLAGVIRRILPHAYHMRLLACALDSLRSVAVRDDTPIAVSRIDAPGDDLLGFADDLEMSPDQVRADLRAGHMAWIAYALSNGGQTEPAGVGWMACTSMDVPEIGTAFCGAGGRAYLCRDFVRPAFRGRGIQRRLLEHRLAAAASMGKGRVYALVARDNRASLRNCQAVGLIEVARACHARAGMLALTRVRMTSTGSAAPLEALPFKGWPNRPRFARLARVRA